MSVKGMKQEGASGAHMIGSSASLQLNICSPDGAKFAQQPPCDNLDFHSGSPDGDVVLVGVILKSSSSLNELDDF